MNRLDSDQVEVPVIRSSTFEYCMQKAKEHRIPLYMCFVDFHKAFDCIKHEKLWVTMLEMGFRHIW